MAKLTQKQANELYGQVVLMGGNESLHWLAKDVDRYAAFARTHNIDSVTLKVADGTWVWHSPSDVQTFRKIALDNGVGFVPFIYSYGNHFGALSSEVALIQSFIDVNENAGIVINMEKEWEGRTDWAASFAKQMKGKKGPVVLSTFGKPSFHNFVEVLKLLSPVVDVMGPEEYTDYLASQENEFNGYVVAPEFDLANDFGPNNVIAHVQLAKQRGHPAWLWTYTSAIPRQPLLRQVTDIMKGTKTVVDPLPASPQIADTPLVADPPADYVFYTTEPGVTLASLAERFLHDASRWKEIREPNPEIVGPDMFLPVGMQLSIPAR